MVFFDWNVFLYLLKFNTSKMSIFLKLCFDRNLNIYKVSGFKDFQKSYLFPNHFFGKLFGYSLLLKNDQYWKTFSMIYVTIFTKKLSFLPVCDGVIKFYILHQMLFFLHFEVIVPCLKLSTHKEQANNL